MTITLPTGFALFLPLIILTITALIHHSIVGYRIIKRKPAKKLLISGFCIDIVWMLVVLFTIIAYIKS